MQSLKEYNWKIFFILLTLCLLSVISVTPYVLTVQGELLRQSNQPLIVILVAQFIQSIILFSVAIFFGLYFTKRINFKLPVIEEIVKKGDYWQALKSILKISVLSGIAVAVAIYLADIVFSSQGASITTQQSLTPIWQTLIASFYGGMAEEVLMRLFLMSFLIWLIVKVFKKNQPTDWVIYTSIILAAIIFGLGHLPITASLTSLTPLIIFRAIILNSIGGIVFGWLFWKKGLESAVIAHFTTDIFLLSLIPLMLRLAIP